MIPIHASTMAVIRNCPVDLAGRCISCGRPVPTSAGCLCRSVQPVKPPVVLPPPVIHPVTIRVRPA